MAKLFRTRTAQSVMPQDPVPAPAPAAPEVAMPVPDDEAVRLAKKRSIASQRARRGRASTIFTDPNNLLGGS